METVVEDVSRGIQQLEYLSNVKLVKCCGELTRGVVEGLIDHKCISKFELEGETVYYPRHSRSAQHIHKSCLDCKHTHTFSPQACLTSYLVRQPPSLEGFVWPNLMFVV